MSWISKMKISKPKPLVELMELLASVTPEQWASMPTFKATDEKGRYLHWDKFKRIYTKNTEFSWLLTKMSRQSLMNVISLDGYSFSFCVPDSLQSLLHFIDKNSGGSVGISNLAGMSKTEQNQFLLKSLVMEEAITSAQLEGAVTTRKVAKEMLETERKPR